MYDELARSWPLRLSEGVSVDLSLKSLDTPTSIPSHMVILRAEILAGRYYSNYENSTANNCKARKVLTPNSY